MSKIQLIILLLITSLGLSSCCDMLCRREQNAKLIIQATERFLEENKRLPNDISELDLPEFEEADTAFYERVNDSIYEVSYGTSLGSSMTYNSKTEEWKEAG